MKNEEPLTRKECMKMFHRLLPEEAIEYWKKHLYMSENEEWGYSVGFTVGAKYVLETVLKPYLDRVDEYLKH